jgi:hypothetical protein
MHHSCIGNLEYAGNAKGVQQNIITVPLNIMHMSSLQRSAAGSQRDSRFRGSASSERLAHASPVGTMISFLGDSVEAEPPTPHNNKNNNT